MTWNPRDYTTQRSQDQGTADAIPPPLPTFDDADPLPTYVSGMELADAPSIPLWQRRALREQGLCLPEQLDRWARLLTRGIPPV